MILSTQIVEQTDQKDKLARLLNQQLISDVADVKQ